MFLPNSKYMSILAGLAAHSGQISVGLSQGFSAVLIPKLLETDFATVSQASWVASLGVISNPLGAVIAGLAAEWFGRRSAVALATLPHAAGWLLIALSTNVPMLYAGRFISGLGTGMANGLYLYVSEAAAPHQRAWLASSGPAMVSFGVLMIYSMGAITTWQRTAAISIGPAILSLALSRLLPETPAWLAARGRMDDAKEALFWLRGPGRTTEVEHQELCSSNSQDKHKKDGILTAIWRPNMWKPFLILFFFFAFQQLSGIYVILFYAVTVLSEIGVSVDEYLGSVGIGVVRLIFSIVGAGLARTFGRRPLACASGLGMAVSAVGVALSIRFNFPSWIPLICIGGHVGASMIGYLTLPWVMTSELYPLKFRGTLSGLTTCLAQILTFGAIKSYPDVSAGIGLEAIMWIFGGAAMLGAIFAMTILPETRGRSLEQIETLFSKKKDNDDIECSTPNLEQDIKNVTLRKFSLIPDDKCSTIKTSAFGYDNFCLDMSLEGTEKPEKSSAREISKREHFSIEHAYL
ncbi:facilitated trehalose transporter Tret1 isoform X2 [Cephus cinctus]|uniref:Facilitated trehalose transporter Tret1 isoform X2 n=1 Tax=Cephus cinctus TaxID=211228 RepID=A0AAJ7C6A2_CEPCN|nr:facilitated trehalose transporter Tret1 isoform X2 [Cephus cinctus]